MNPTMLIAIIVIAIFLFTIPLQTIEKEKELGILDIFELSSDKRIAQNVGMHKYDFIKLYLFQILTSIILLLLTIFIAFNLVVVTNPFLKQLNIDELPILFSIVISGTFMLIGACFGGFGLYTILNPYKAVCLHLVSDKCIVLGVILALNIVNSILIIFKTNMLSPLSLLNILSSLLFICIAYKIANKEKKNTQAS